MILRRAVAFAVAALVLAATPSLADMLIKLRDGQVITVPVQPNDIESLSFTGARVVLPQLRRQRRRLRSPRPSRSPPAQPPWPAKPLPISTAARIRRPMH